MKRIKVTDNYLDKHSPRISVVMASFNRRDITIRCLHSLQDQSNTPYSLRVFILDDASSDGTVDGVYKAFPEATILKGNGKLFWGGAMNVAMSAALKQPHDFILLLNDDVTLAPGAICTALQDYQDAKARQGNDKQIIVGAVISPSSGLVTYSGFRRLNRLRPAKLERITPRFGALTRCSTMNGNFVLIPRAVTWEIGPIDGRFIHQLGDLDYGYRAVKIGASLWIASRPVGSCEVNTRKMPFEKPGLSLIERWQKINTPLGLPLGSWALFMWRHGGVLSLLELGAIYMKVLWKIRRGENDSKE